jgi:TusA-related sulfurtransferase
MAGDAIEANIVEDCVGLYCPEPIFRTRKAFDGLEIGQVLEVIADDPAAEEDLKRWAKRMGQELINIRNDDGELHIFIKRLI